MNFAATLTTFALTASLATALAAPAVAAAPVTIRADVVDPDGVVTLGEIFDGAGAAGATPIARRPMATVMLNAQAVRLAAARAGLDWPNAEGLRQIVVRGPAAVGGMVVAARGNVDVLTWARSIPAGEIVQPSDLVWGKAAMAPADAPSEPEAMIGMAARRPLRAGAVVTGRDVSAPQVVAANEMVTLTYDNGGVSLSLQAKALAGGAVGELINVQNVTSKKTVQAVVTGPGQAAVGPQAEELKLVRSSRYALR